MEKICPKCGARMFLWKYKLINVHKRNARRPILKCPNCGYETDTD
ncbi:MAG: hypothetical protein QMC78_03670 [Methanocellales archaeon]|nr:hypothetical protein [Methanocellales archaeon]